MGQVTPKWIRVEDKMPDEEADLAVFVYLKELGISIGKCDHLDPPNWIVFIDYDVQYIKDITHWAEIDIRTPYD